MKVNSGKDESEFGSYLVIDNPQIPEDLILLNQYLLDYKVDGFVMFGPKILNWSALRPDLTYPNFVNYREFSFSYHFMKVALDEIKLKSLENQRQFKIKVPSKWREIKQIKNLLVDVFKYEDHDELERVDDYFENKKLKHYAITIKDKRKVIGVGYCFYKKIWRF